MSEARPGAVWRHHLDEYWPGWLNWIKARGGIGSYTEKESLRALRRHMPEMENLIDTLAAHRPDDPALREFLGFWCPPRYLVSCTQAVSSDSDGPFLLRNYDLDPELSEATLMRTGWRGKKVMGMADGLAGLSDGMNEDGLAVSLSFGGRVVIGKGFGIPLIIRYVLETCTDVQDGIEALRAVPSHMSYNVTLTDRSGTAATAFLAPDRPTIVSRTPWATNHQLGVEWPRHGRISATLERAQVLGHCFAQQAPVETTLARAFSAPPIFSRNYKQGFGTVYTACYRPDGRTARLSWGDGQGQSWHMDNMIPGAVDVEYSDTGSRVIKKWQEIPGQARAS